MLQVVRSLAFNKINKVGCLDHVCAWCYVTGYHNHFSMSNQKKLYQFDHFQSVEKAITSFIKNKSLSFLHTSKLTFAYTANIALSYLLSFLIVQHKVSDIIKFNYLSIKLTGQGTELQEMLITKHQE